MKDEVIIAALLTSATVREAAATAGVTTATIYNKLKNARFKEKFTKAKTNLLAQTTTYLQANTAEAIKIIKGIADDEETNPQTRLLACRALCDYSIKFTEQIDILTRLENLEGERGN